MRRGLLLALAGFAASPALAQSMPGMSMHHHMPGMTMPEAPPRQAADPASQPSMPGMDMSGMDMPPATTGAMPSAAVGTDQPAGHAAPPPPPADHYADRAYPPAAMAKARARMMREEGGQYLGGVMFNLAEIQLHHGDDSYRWDAEGWFGGDRNRLVVKSEGEGGFHKGVEAAEVQALYSRAIGPWFDVQAGVRQDIRPSPARTYATLGIEGLAPYLFETEAALFLSTKGDLLARAEGWTDARLTQRLILQPRVELNFAAQDVPEDQLGAGVTDAEIGVRLRYEISRRFAPYVGWSWERRTGRTARLLRAAGESPRSSGVVFGIRGWL